MTWPCSENIDIEEGKCTVISRPRIAQYFRLCYVNNSALAVTLTLQTIYNRHSSESLFSTDPSRFLPVRISDGSVFLGSNTSTSRHLDMLEFLEKILLEQRKTNLHLSVLTEETLEEEDLGE